MSIDSIVTVKMIANSPQLGRMRFDIPLLLGYHSRFTEVARTYTDLDGMKSDGFKPDDALYKMAQQLLFQQPRVSEFIVGRRESESAKIEDDLTKIHAAHNDFYGLLIDSSDPATILAASEWAEMHKVLFAVDLSDKQYLEPRKTDADNLPIPETLAGLNRSQTILTYHPNETAYFAAAFMGRMLAEGVGEGTWANRILNNVPVYRLSSNEQKNLKDKNINYMINVKNISVSQLGQAANGIFIDTVRCSNWFPVQIQERLFNLFIAHPKIPPNNKGMALLYYTLKTLADEAVAMGVLAEKPEPQVIVPDASEILDEDRKKRHLTKIRINGRYQGAIHSLEIHCHITQ